MKKIVGFIIFTLLISGTGFSVIGIENNNPNSLISQIKKSNTPQIGTFASPNDFIIDVIQQINETMYLGYLENITAFGPRLTGTNASYAAGEYIYNEFKNMDLYVRFHNWSSGPYSDRNVVATLPGVNETSNEFYIICGHFDTVVNSPGADDDASGVATVMTAAFILKQYSFDHTIRFIAFSGEEQWMRGSGAYAHEAHENGDNIIAVLNVDMIGFAISTEDGNKIKIHHNNASMWLVNYTDNVSEEFFEYINLDVIPSGSSPSDQSSFWEYGYDGIFYNEYNFNDYYHTYNDTIENMNLTYAIKCSKLIIATLAKLVQQQQPTTPNITGPIIGFIMEKYEFSIVATDPDKDQIFYFIDWGDNNNSSWVGPYASDTELKVNHTWTALGEYEIRAKIKDRYGGESNWSYPFIITILKEPILDIQNIKGGFFRVSSKIKNNGDLDAINVNWSISIDGGTFMGVETTGVDNIPAGGEISVKSKFIFGFGSTTVIITAKLQEDVKDKRSQDGFVLLFFIKINPGG